MERITVQKAMQELGLKYKRELADALKISKQLVSNWGVYVPELWQYKIHFLITEKNKETTDGETA